MHSSIIRMLPRLLVLILIILAISVMMPQLIGGCGVQTNPYPCG